MKALIKNEFADFGKNFLLLDKFLSKDVFQYHKLVLQKAKNGFHIVNFAPIFKTVIWI